MVPVPSVPGLPHAETPLKTSKRGQAAHAAIRSVCPTMEKDRVMYKDFARLAELIASGKLADVVR
jgi:histidine ammonia-lyase